MKFRKKHGCGWVSSIPGSFVDITQEKEILTHSIPTSTFLKATHKMIGVTVTGVCQLAWRRPVNDCSDPFRCLETFEPAVGSAMIRYDDVYMFVAGDFGRIHLSRLLPRLLYLYSRRSGDVRQHFDECQSTEGARRAKQESSRGTVDFQSKLESAARWIASVQWTCCNLFISYSKCSLC